MKRHFASLCSLCVCVFLCALPAVAQGGFTVVGVSLDTVRTINLVSGTSVSHQITIPGKTVGTTFGLARDPQTGAVYALVAYFSPGGRFLVTVDPATGAGTNIGQTPVVSDIAFGADGTLYAVGGNSAGSGGALYVLDKATGAGTQLAQLSSGSGHVLAFNAEDGLLYHGANTCDDFDCFFYLETFDPQAPAPPVQKVKTLPNQGIESGSLVHLRGSFFLMGAVFPGQFQLLNAATGSAAFLNSDTSWQGLATLPAGGACPPVGTLYATGPFEGAALLHSIDPATGAATLVGPMGFNDVSGIDFAADAVLYAVGTRDDDSGVQVLLTVDPCTGEGTEVGPTGASLRELMAAPGGGLYAYSGQNFSTIDKVTGAATIIGNSAITADDFGLEYSPTDDKIYFANIFNAIGTLYSIDPATGASTVVSQLTLPPNITALRAMDFNVANNTMYALIADSAFPGTTSLATVNTTSHVVSIVGTTNRFTTLAFKNGTPNSNYVLTVIKEGSGNGAITSSPAGIDCGTTCQFAFDTGTKVTLTAVAGLNAVFTGWSGACTGTGSCVTTVNAMRTVRANFELVVHLTISYGSANLGTGEVSPLGALAVNGPCSLGTPPGCVYSYLKGAEANLEPVGDFPSTFVSWAGDCTGQGPCILQMDSDKNVQVNFSAVRHLTLTVVNPVGTNLMVDDRGQSCSSGTCDFRYAPGDATLLHFTDPVPANIQVLGRFSGDCTGVTCSLTMDTDHAVTASFLDGFDVVATLNGTGTGTVGSLNCSGLTCRNRFLLGSTANITGIPNNVSFFTGFGGACSGTAQCNLTSNTVTTFQLTATFDASAHTLTINRSGLGTVTSNPAGINCGQTCAASFPPGTVVTLTATPDVSSTVGPWSGDCVGTSCQLTMDVDHTATIGFNLKTFPVTVALAGTGTGTVIGGLINCPGTCSISSTYGNNEAFTATPSAESAFAGWSGDCTGSNPCHLLVTSAKNATANFAFVGPFNFGSTPPPPVTIPAGQPAVFNLSVQQHTGSSGTITFTCSSGLPSAASCTFNPASIPFTSGTNTAINTQLTITTTVRTIAMADPPGRLNPVWALSLFALVFVVPRRRRSQLLLGLAFAFVVFLPACGGGGHPTTTTKTQSGTPAGTYTVTVNGSTGNVIKTTTVNLVVQ